MTVLKRVTTAPTANTTTRLVPTLRTVDPWAGSWSSVWASAWGTPGMSLGLAADNTKRISATVSVNITKRVSGV